MVFCNFSETSCGSLTAKEEPFVQPSVIPSFKSRNHKYINSNAFESPYDNFKDTANIKDSSSTLNDGDFVVLDGSLSDVNLKSFKGNNRQHKFAYDRLYNNYGVEGEVAKYISFGFSVYSITESSGTATATTSTAHSLTTGDTVTISGATVTAYNSSFSVVVAGPTTFTF